MRAHTLFFSALGNPEPSRELQEQAYRYAVKTKSTGILVRLAQHPNVTPEIEARLKASNELDVLSAWAGRPDLDAQELVERFRKEKRVTLLQSIAEMGDLPEELYEELADRNAVSLNWTLVSNAAVPINTRKRVAKALGAASVRRDSRAHTEVADLLRRASDVAGEFIAECSNSTALTALIRQTEEKNTDLAKAGVARIAKIVGDTRDDDAWYALSRLASQTDSRDVLLAVESETGGLIEGLTEDDPLRAALVKTRDLAHDRAAVDIPSMLNAVAVAPTPQDIRTEMSQITSKLRGLGYYLSTSEFAPAVLANPNADADLVSNYLAWASAETIVEIAQRALDNRDRALLVEVMDFCATRSLGDMVSKFYERSDCPEEFLTWVIGDEEFPPTCVIRAAVVANDPELAVRLLPATTVLSSASAQALLIEQLGSSPEKWDTFTTLLEDWTGTLPDLLVAAGSLSGTA